jgi:hypothetical protein
MTRTIRGASDDPLRPTIEPHAAATVRWIVAADDPATASPTVSKTVRAPPPWRTIRAKMSDERPVIGRIGYRRHPSATPCDHRHFDNPAQTSSLDFAGARYRSVDDDREVQQTLTTVTYTDHQTARSPAACVSVSISARMLSAREPRECIRLPVASGFSCRLHGLYLLISDPFLGGFLGPEPGHHLQVTAGRLGFHLEGLASIRVWDNPINCHAANMA